MMTHAEAVSASSARRRASLSHGLSLNALAHWDGEVNKDLAKKAKSIFTPEDKKALRKGG